MTFQLVASLDCDHDGGCHATLRLLPGETLNEARKRARLHGWGLDRLPLKSNSIVRDYCPAHRKK
jgi:hypothetical protein